MISEWPVGPHRATESRQCANGQSRWIVRSRQLDPWNPYSPIPHLCVTKNVRYGTRSQRRRSVARQRASHSPSLPQHNKRIYFKRINVFFFFFFLLFLSLQHHRYWPAEYTVCARYAASEHCPLRLHCLWARKQFDSRWLLWLWLIFLHLLMAWWVCVILFFFLFVPFTCLDALFGRGSLELHNSRAFWSIARWFMSRRLPARNIFSVRYLFYVSN